jgi:hypothetical protein
MKPLSPAFKALAAARASLDLVAALRIAAPPVPIVVRLGEAVVSLEQAVSWLALVVEDAIVGTSRVKELEEERERLRTALAHYAKGEGGDVARRALER